MTLRIKTLLIVGLTLLALFVVLFITLSFVLKGGFTSVENEDVEENVNRAVKAIEDDISTVNTTVGDWAPWDDTHTFASDGNEDYINDNLAEGTFTNLGINVMVFVDADGKVVYGQGIDLESGEFAGLQASLEAEIAGADLLLTHENVSSSFEGVVLLPENPMMVASQPILTSDGEGPINGTLLMGRYLDDDQIDDLEAALAFEITIERLDGGPLPADFQAALDALALPDADDIHIRPLEDAERIAGYKIKNDVYGEPALILKVDMPRDVLAQFQRTRQFFIISLSVVGVFFVLVTLIILERLVLFRLFRLSEGVTEIGASGNLAGRLTVPGRDELGQLASAINQMLQDLQESLAREKELKAEVQRLRIQIDQVKKEKSVSEIVESDYFQDLQQKARDMRSSKSKKDDKAEDN